MKFFSDERSVGLLEDRIKRNENSIIVVPVDSQKVLLNLSINDLYIKEDKTFCLNKNLDLSFPIKTTYKIGNWIQLNKNFFVRI
jgi:hypothetical protein